MRKFIIAAVAVFGTYASNAQDYKAPLEKTFGIFDTATVMEAKIEMANKVSLIAKKWPTEWQTHYYAALCKTVLSYMEKDASKRDAYLDEAEKEHDEAVSVQKKENDETYVLAAMIANARLAVDGSTRWMKYGKIFTANLENAKKLNPDNPRIYYLDGTAKLFTPKAFGGGKKAAMPYFEKAAPLFEKEAGADITKPHWGKDRNAMHLAECKAGD